MKLVNWMIAACAGVGLVMMFGRAMEREASAQVTVSPGVVVYPGVVIAGALPFVDTLHLWEGDSFRLRTQLRPFCQPGETTVRVWWHIHARTITQTPFKGVVLLHCGARP